MVDGAVAITTGGARFRRRRKDGLGIETDRDGDRIRMFRAGRTDDVVRIRDPLHGRHYQLGNAVVPRAIGVDIGSPGDTI